MAVASTTPVLKAPGKISRLAVQHELGELAAVYRPKFTNPLVILGIALAIAAVDIAAIVVIYQLGFIVYYLSVIPIIALIWAITTLRSANLRVYIFTNGFIRARGRRGVAIRWEQIQTIWESVKHSAYGTIYTYTVRCADGRVFKQGSPLQNRRDMGILMMRQVVKLQLPVAKAAYDAGQTLSFGSITVNMQGLGTGGQIVPWSQIDRVTSQNGIVFPEKQGRRINWPAARSAEVPNLAVLLALARSILQEQK